MPSPLYFYPFINQTMHLALGVNFSATTLLHSVSPHVTKAHYKYRSNLGAASATFQGYMANTDRIYVLGHGVAGSDVLTTEAGTTPNDRCTASELAQLLVDHGLQMGSQVHIRINACNSGTPPASGANGVSFAEQLKWRMQGHNLGAVTVRGYDTAVGIYVGWRWGGLGPANAHAHDY